MLCLGLRSQIQVLSFAHPPVVRFMIRQQPLSIFDVSTFPQIDRGHALPREENECVLVITPLFYFKSLQTTVFD